MKEYDAIIVGASFAGLSVASQLKKNVLLIDRFAIGTFQISACAVPYDILEQIGCLDSVLQICDIFSFHISNKRIDFHFKRPYCTFDFARFCEQLYSKSNAEFLKTHTLKVEKQDLFTVYTPKGNFSSKILVDATGWQASLSEGLKPGDRKSTRLNSSHTDISRMPSSA